MLMFNIPQALLWIAIYECRKFGDDELNERLTKLAASIDCEDRPNSLLAVHLKFQAPIKLQDAKEIRDIPESMLGAGSAVAAVIYKTAHDELLRAGLSGKITMRGCPLSNGIIAAVPHAASIGYLPGWEPAARLEAIPPDEFARLTFIDGDKGVEAVPKESPARGFPRWCDLSLVADDVRKLWPLEAAIDIAPPPVVKAKKPDAQLSEATEALKKIYPDGKPSSINRPVMKGKVEDKIGRPISLSTLDRARKKLWPK
jgi:hypothetical protein